MKKNSIVTIVGLIALLLSPVAMRAANTHITNEGIGKVKIGATISKLPDSINGVYDRIEFATEEGFDEGAYEYTYDVYHAYLKDAVVFDIFPAGGKVNSITVYSDKLKTKNGLSLSSTPRELFAAGGKAISFNDGTVAIVCDGAIFFDMPLSEAGINKAEQAYFGYEVAFDASDFEESGHSRRVVLNGEHGNQPVATSAPNMSLKDTLLASLFLAVLLAILGHMIYVNFFAKPFPEETIALQGTDLNNSYVISRVDNLYNNVFTTYQESGDTEPLKFPVGKQAASESKRTLKDIYDNHMPVGGEAAEKLRKVSILTNHAYKRSFTGSIKFLVITIIVGVGACLLNKDAKPLLYFLPACVLYYFSCMTPYYIQMEKALKEMKTGRRSGRFMDAILGGIFGFAASAPMIVEITKDARSGEVLDKRNDSSLQIFALALSIILFIILAYVMLFVALLNYVRNYILR
ncbi:MAG: hypothetical protein IJR25_05055 [Bacteroidales bacterium]|nr:hypothetical protein [Bacteroidales bacterium]